MDYITLSLAIVTVANAALGLILLLNSKGSKVAGVYAINIVTILFWTASMMFFRQAGAMHELMWTRMLYVGASLIASTFVYFTYTFPHQEKIGRREYGLIFIPNLLLLGLILFTNTIITAIEHPLVGEKVILFGSLFGFYGVYILAYFAFGFYRLILKYQQSSNKTERRQIIYLLGGYVVSANIAFVTNLILPLFHIFAFNWMGQVSTILMVSFALYSILKHHLFSVQVIASELFAFGLSALVLARTLLSETLREQLINGIQFIFVVLISILFVRNMIKEVRDKERIAELADSLKNTNKKLRALDQQKSEFISIATHQLRAPLTSIKGYTSMIMEGSYGKVPKKIEEIIDRIFRSTNALTLVVSDFLDISRIEQGRMRYDKTKFDLKDLVSEVVYEQEPTAKAKGITLNYSFNNTETYPVYADRTKMRQVIANLLDNAIKYTNEGHVGVCMKRVGDKVRFWTEDTGIGMSEDTISILFEKFSRAQNANKTNVMGTGLGLYVAKQLIEAHSGLIWAESDGVGKGSRFIFEITKDI